jgi:hypothetical protein
MLPTWSHLTSFWAIFFYLSGPNLSHWPFCPARSSSPWGDAMPCGARTQSIPASPFSSSAVPLDPPCYYASYTEPKSSRTKVPRSGTCVCPGRRHVGARRNRHLLELPVVPVSLWEILNAFKIIQVFLVLPVVYPVVCAVHCRSRVRQSVAAPIPIAARVWPPHYRNIQNWWSSRGWSSLGLCVLQSRGGFLCRTCIRACARHQWFSSCMPPVSLHVITSAGRSLSCHRALSWSPPCTSASCDSRHATSLGGNERSPLPSRSLPHTPASDDSRRATSPGGRSPLASTPPDAHMQPGAGVDESPAIGNYVIDSGASSGTPSPPPPPPPIQGPHTRLQQCIW